MCFKYTLEVVDASEDDFAFEYFGSPLAIVDNFAVSADNDVSLVHDDLATPQLSSLLTPYGEISEALSKFETGTGSMKSASRPEDFFNLPDEVQLMMDYHNGMNG